MTGAAFTARIVRRMSTSAWALEIVTEGFCKRWPAICDRPQVQGEMFNRRRVINGTLLRAGS